MVSELIIHPRKVYVSEYFKLFTYVVFFSINYD